MEQVKEFLAVMRAISESQGPFNLPAAHEKIVAMVEEVREHEENQVLLANEQAKLCAIINERDKKIAEMTGKMEAMARTIKVAESDSINWQQYAVSKNNEILNLQKFLTVAENEREALKRERDSAVDNAVGRVIEMNDRIVELERAVKTCEQDMAGWQQYATDKNNEIIGLRDNISQLTVINNTLKHDCEVFMKRIREITAHFDGMNAQSNETIKEMGEKIDEDAALVVSFREMPVIRFADDPHAAIAAIVKADIDKTPVDWAKWPW